MDTIKTLSGNQNNIQSVLTASPFKPFRYISKGIEKKMDQFWFNRITNSLETDKSQLIEVNSDNQLEGFIVINDLPWDSKILKTNMASISEFILNPNSNSKELVARELLERAITTAKNSGYLFLLCKVFSHRLNDSSTQRLDISSV